MGPSESPTGQVENQQGRRKRTARRPRTRLCLLKGCDHRFQPRQARQRYCSQCCREAARKWSRWKAQQRYRRTAAGQQKRKDQSQRYRERSRKPAEPKAVNDVARVITTEHFFRPFLRSAWLLRGIRMCAAKSFTTFLHTRLSARSGARPRPGAALETSAYLIRRY
jgi:hypothetical protein